MADETSFETNLRQLEKTVKALESGDLGLDAALAQYETGIRLLGECHTLLDNAGRKVALLTGVDEGGEPTREPFDATASFEAPTKSRPAASQSLDDLPF